MIFSFFLNNARFGRPKLTGCKMSKNEPVSLKTVSNMMLGGGAIALALVFAVWGVLGIFVI